MCLILDMRKVAVTAPENGFLIKITHYLENVIIKKNMLITCSAGLVVFINSHAVVVVLACRTF